MLKNNLNFESLGKGLCKKYPLSRFSAFNVMDESEDTLHRHDEKSSNELQ